MIDIDCVLGVDLSKVDVEDALVVALGHIGTINCYRGILDRTTAQRDNLTADRAPIDLKAGHVRLLTHLD